MNEGVISDRRYPALERLTGTCPLLARGSKQPPPDLVAANPATTRDRRYLVVRGRLWRRSNPALPEAQRQQLVAELMTARGAVAAARRGCDVDAERLALDEAAAGGIS